MEDKRYILETLYSFEHSKWQRSSITENSFSNFRTAFKEFQNLIRFHTKIRGHRLIDTGSNGEKHIELLSRIDGIDYISPIEINNK